jgi:hypothetical protein
MGHCAYEMKDIGRVIKDSIGRSVEIVGDDGNYFIYNYTYQ